MIRNPAQLKNQKNSQRMCIAPFSGYPPQVPLVVIVNLMLS